MPAEVKLRVLNLHRLKLAQIPLFSNCSTSAHYIFCSCVVENCYGICHNFQHRLIPSQTTIISIWSFMSWICVFSCEPSLEVMEPAMTGRETPHARPKAVFDLTKMYGTFLSSFKFKCQRQDPKTSAGIIQICGRACDDNDSCSM